MKHAIALRYRLPFRLLCMLLICGFAVQPLRAQLLCQGSLGDPIVNITFGGGNNPGPPLSAVQGLQYYSSDCPNDGFYSIRNSTSACFNNTWHTISADHTGNGSGYFMLINGSVQPSVFYIDTVHGLCGGTTYEFAAWIMNVQQPSAVTVCNGSVILPNVTFTIERTDGTVLVSYTIGNVPTSPQPFWRQYGVFFNTPASVSDVVLRIRNNAPGGCGNDIALDDITFRPCGPQIEAAIVNNNSDTLNFCEGTAHNFQLNAFFVSNTGIPAPALQWQQRSNGGIWADIPGATSNTYSGTLSASAIAGLYEYRMGAASAANIATLRCRTFSKPLKITINANPIVTISTSGTKCAEQPFTLTGAGADQYSWSGPNGFTASGSVVTIYSLQANQGGTYSVLATSLAGCTATNFVQVDVLPAVNINTSFTDTTICQKVAVQLLATGGSSYRWLPATGLSANNISNPTAAPIDSLTYQVIASALGCSDTAYVNINVIKPPISDAGPDKAVIKGTPTSLAGSIRGQYAQFYWLPAAGLSNPQQLQPTVSPTVDVTYWLTAVAPKGCGISVDTVHVRVFRDILIPSAFTPNGDGLNDVWSIASLQAYPHFELSVFNRWGTLVFQAKNQYKTWDGLLNGKPLPAGAYIYYLSIPDTQKNWRGTVMLLR